jgi:hypothetical protein
VQTVPDRRSGEGKPFKTSLWLKHLLILDRELFDNPAPLGKMPGLLASGQRLFEQAPVLDVTGDLL